MYLGKTGLYSAVVIDEVTQFKQERTALMAGYNTYDEIDARRRKLSPPILNVRKAISYQFLGDMGGQNGR
jgi:hypothetical protein